ncbi:Cullin-4A [Sarcoptes scabiei]|nr:Cullin-4A [Sarcoptes scabiei]
MKKKRMDLDEILTTENTVETDAIVMASAVIDSNQTIDSDMLDTTNSRHFKIVKNQLNMQTLDFPPTNLTNNHGNVRTFTGKTTTIKKLTIKNFEKPRLPEDYFNKTWKGLEKAIVAIQKSQSIEVSYESLYQDVQNLCSHHMEPIVYKNLSFIINAYIEDQIIKTVEPIIENIAFLEMIEKCWNHHCNQMTMIRCIFLYLDRTYVLQNAKICSIWDLGLDLFRSNISINEKITKRIRDSLLKLISIERKGEKINRILIKNILRMLMDLSLYTPLFEMSFLEETRVLYDTESKEKINELNIFDYLSYIEKRLTEENDRLMSYLDHSTSRKLIPIVEKELIQNNLDTMLKMKLETLIDNAKSDQLKLAYNLFSRVPDGLTKLVGVFNNYVKNKGKQIVCNNVDLEKTMVQDLLDFKDKMDEIIINCFSNESKFINSLKEAFEYFINQRPNKPAELIAKFVDAKLRTGNKECGDEELEKILDKVMVLFRFIHGKDIFDAFYKKDLAKRLLLGKSASVDAEKTMLLKLRQECGSAFTSKLEGMFKDMELSREIAVNFKQYLNNVCPEATIDMNVYILTTGYWPTYQAMDVIVPPEMLKYEEFFLKFYVSKHMGRKLQWQRNLGHCILKAYFRTGVKELQVSLFQALILLLFNDGDGLSLSDIKSKTMIEENELIRTLQSLACGKARVIIKQPKGLEIQKADKFFFNNAFTNKLFRIKINQIQLKETLEENETTQERVIQDRQYQIDAAVVRIMKTRKSLQFNVLMSEIYSQLKFPASTTEVKKRIDSLVDRDYLFKDKTNPNILNYIA